LSEITVAKEGERLYLDSMVIIAYLQKSHRLHAKATSIMSKIEQSKFEGVVSSLTLMEFIKILRGAFIRSGNKDMKAIEDAIREMVKVLYHIDNLYFVEGRPPEFCLMDEIKTVFFHNISQIAFEMICKYRGRIKDSSGELEHYGLSPMDVLHLALAKKLGCDKIVTDDWAFKDAEKEITPLILTDFKAYW
jgi:predicted nucleic acid-binding protein